MMWMERRTRSRPDALDETAAYRLATETLTERLADADRLWKSVSAIKRTAGMIGVGTERKESFIELRKMILKKHRAFSSFGGDYPEGSGKPESVLYRALGYWLCAYWLGTPDLNVWNRIVSSIDNAGVFPGDAFYDKLCGDIYRYESRQISKGLPGTRPPVLVVAFSPTLLFSEPLKRVLAQPYWSDKGELADDELEFRQVVRSLSDRYIRLQAWRYFFLTHSTSVRLQYVIDVDVVKKSLVKLAVDGSCLGLESLDSTAEDAELVRRLDVTAELCRLWARCFVAEGEDVDGVRVVPVDSAQTSAFGLTSCVLGPDIGVISARRNSPGQLSRMSRWLTGEELRGERDKVRRAIENRSRVLSPAHWCASEWFAADEKVPAMRAGLAELGFPEASHIA